MKDHHCAVAAAIPKPHWTGNNPWEDIITHGLATGADDNQTSVLMTRGRRQLLENMATLTRSMP